MANPGPIGANYTGCCIRTSENSPSTHSGEYPEAALLRVHRLRLAFQLARLLPPQAPAKSTVAVIMTIRNSYLFFLVGWRGCHPPPPALKTFANYNLQPKRFQ